MTRNAMTVGVHERAPARQVPPGELTPDVSCVEAHHPAPVGNRGSITLHDLGAGVIGVDRERVAPLRRTRHDHCAGGLAPSAPPAQLDPPRCHGLCLPALGARVRTLAVGRRRSRQADAGADEQRAERQEPEIPRQRVDHIVPNVVNPQ
jgi:hypothetical protein